jgi:hypothetical protein
MHGLLSWRSGTAISALKSHEQRVKARIKSGKAIFEIAGKANFEMAHLFLYQRAYICR